MRVNIKQVRGIKLPTRDFALGLVLALCALSGGAAQAAPGARATRAHKAHAPGEVPPAPPAPASVPAPAPAAAQSRLEHDVPQKVLGEDDEVPIDWVVRDGRLSRRPQVLSLDVGVWPDTLSLGAFWAAPVLPRGFIRHINDSFDLEFGLMLGAMRSDWYWNRADASTSWQLWPAFGGRWNFFLTHSWSTFITFKLAGRIGLSGPSPGWFDVFAGAGATYRIKERVHLRLELNYPQGAVVGLSFPIGAL